MGCCFLPDILVGFYDSILSEYRGEKKNNVEMLVLKTSIGYGCNFFFFLKREGVWGIIVCQSSFIGTEIPNTPGL